MSVKESAFKRIEVVLWVAAVCVVGIYLWQDKVLLYDAAAVVVSVVEWLQAQFSSITYSTPWYVLAAPALCALLLLAFLFLSGNNGFKPLRAFTVSVLFVFSTIYIVFRLAATMNMDSWPDAALSVTFVAIEVTSYVCLASLYLQLAWPADRSRHVRRSVEAVSSGRYCPAVDIFIPTYNEPVDMLRRTVIGCQAMAYPHKRVWLLDDGNRVTMKALADDLGCSYLSRPVNTHAKAGNLNNAMAHSSGELVVVFDADCVPVKDFLVKTAGFFEDPAAGLVITDQYFYNAKMFGDHGSIERVISAEQTAFFSEAQAGRDNFNALLCFGTGFVVRRRHMEELGGFPTETLAEDWATSIKLQAAGYKTFAVKEMLTAGAAAESVGEFIQQRLRWGQGTLQALFASTNPLRIRGLSFLQRGIHMYGIFYYIMFPLQLLAMFIPLFYFFFGMVPFRATVPQLIFFFLPYFLMHQMVFSWICKKYSSIFSFHVYEYLLYVPLTLVAVRMFRDPFGRPFRVTKKGICREDVCFNMHVAFPLLGILLLYAAGIVYGAFNARWISGIEYSAGMFLWCGFRAMILWITLQVAFDYPQERNAVRFPHSLPCSVSADGREYPGRTRDLSETGALFELTCEDGALVPGCNAAVSLPSLGMHGVDASVVHRGNNGRIGLRFCALTQDSHRRLVEFLYCEPGRWEDVSMTALEAAKTLVKSVFTVYPIERCRR